MRFVLAVRRSFLKATQLSLFGDAAPSAAAGRVRAHERALPSGKVTHVVEHASGKAALAARNAAYGEAWSAARALQPSKFDKYGGPIFRPTDNNLVAPDLTPPAQQEAFAPDGRVLADYERKHEPAPAAPPPVVDAKTRAKWIAELDRGIASANKSADKLDNPDRKVNTRKRIQEAAQAVQRQEAFRKRAAMLERMKARVESGEATAEEMLFTHEPVARFLKYAFPWKRGDHAYDDGGPDYAADASEILAKFANSARNMVEHASSYMQFYVKDHYKKEGDAQFVSGYRELMDSMPVSSNQFGRQWRAWVGRASELSDSASGSERTHTWYDELKLIAKLTGKDDPTAFDLVPVMRRYAEWRAAVSGGEVKPVDPDAPISVVRDATWEDTPERARRTVEVDRGFSHMPTSIPGYFPTPPSVTEKLIAAVHPRPGELVLEPSAGRGHMADRLPGDVRIHVLEFNTDNAHQLKRKGYDVRGHDFLVYNPTGDDRPHKIIMNPPFEKGADVEHVRHAYEVLRPGGTLAAVMSEGPFFRQQTKDREFREWLDGLDATVERLPEGSFKRSNTGVSTRMVVVRKPMAKSIVASAFAWRWAL